MRFVSTRGSADPVNFAEAFAAGLAPDGGLYVPEELPQLVPELLAEESSSYADLAFRFLSAFDTTHEPAVLRDIVDRSYSVFDDNSNPAPLVELSENLAKRDDLSLALLTLQSFYRDRAVEHLDSDPSAASASSACVSLIQECAISMQQNANRQSALDALLFGLRNLR